MGLCFVGQFVVSGVRIGSAQTRTRDRLGVNQGRCRLLMVKDPLMTKYKTLKTPRVASGEKEEVNFDTILQELSAIQDDGPRKVAILGTRYCSYLHQQIIELLTYANVLIGNEIYTSGAGGTNAAVVRGAFRAEKPDLLTVVLPQSISKQANDQMDQLMKVKNLIEMNQNDDLPLDVASRLCNSKILTYCTHFIAFAFHDSDVILEAAREAKSLGKVVTLLYLD
ncbi:hypothetical protein NDN08_002183 [Rhodosorus marinus]|uniref:Uncharacterized protein n=2 Tax=Rhodosorus marinus TaxID=101924 RepID=A0AAV8UXB1_9RHOD|nr:hypothetical protein NDN08_002183 [Rhodosorus marinus]